MTTNTPVVAPAGWRLVPEEPTTLQLASFFEAAWPNSVLSADDQLEPLRRGWATALDAAPTPPHPASGDVAEKLRAIRAIIERYPRAPDDLVIWSKDGLTLGHLRAADLLSRLATPNQWLPIDKVPANTDVVIRSERGRYYVARWNPDCKWFEHHAPGLRPSIIGTPSDGPFTHFMLLTPPAPPSPEASHG